MSRAADVCAGLLKHKSVLLRELSESSVLDVLAKRGLLSVSEHEAVRSARDPDVQCESFTRIVSQYDAGQITQLCAVLERECPDLTAQLLRDRDTIITNGFSYDTKENMVMDHNLNRQSPRSRRSVSQCSCSNSTSPATTPASPQHPPHQLNNTVEVYVEPVVEQTSGGRTGGGSGWETHRVRLSRVAGFGFGIAVSGGRDNPHFASGDPSIAVSDVLRGGPAEDKLQVNDRIISVNGVSVENVEYARAVQVLRECGASVTLVVRRRVPAPPHTASTTLHFTLTRHNKKEDWGVELGCRVYVKRLSQRAKDQLNAAGHSLCEGDVITNINNTTLTEETTLKEARKLLGSCRERVALQVSRELAREETVTSLHPPGVEALSPTYSGQNLYVSAPSRDLQPPRPPPPCTNDYYGNGRTMYEEESRAKPPPSEPRLISFQKEGSVGVRVCGGNRSGVFVSGVQPASPAALQGLQPADKILKVNEMEMSGVTREEAVLFLLSLQERIDLIVQHAPAEYAAVARNDTPGDWFHIRTHFHYAEPADGELAFRSGDVFRVIDTLHNGTVGAWRVARIGRNNTEVQKGIIPNKARAEELATAQFNALKKEAAGSERAPSGLFRRRRSTHRRAKSLGKEQWEEVVLESSSKLPAYERVVLRAPGPPRPVVLLGACADLAAHALTHQQPHKYTQPLCSEEGGGGGVVRASWVRGAGERGLHAVLAVPPAAVLRLNYAQLYPIVVFLKPDSKQTVKRLRQGAQRGVGSRKSSKKVLEDCVWVERTWSHVVTHTLSLGDNNISDWTDKLRDIITSAQQQHIWVSENTMRWGVADDLVCALGTDAAGQSRLSYASSPESEPDTAPAPALPRATSQPALAPPHHHPAQHHPAHQPPPAYTVNGVSENKYGSSAGGDPPPPRTPLYGIVPELPPRGVGGGVAGGAGGGGGTGARVSAHERLFPSSAEPTHHYSPHQGAYEYGSAGVGPNAPDDLKVAPPQKVAGPGGGGGAEVPNYTHGGLYTHARAVSLPAPPAPAVPPPASLHNNDYTKYRSGTYKPVPPPKPKHYRAPDSHTHHHQPPPTHTNMTGVVDSGAGSGGWSHTHAQPDHYTHALRYQHNDTQPVAGPPQSPPYSAPPPPRLQHIDLAGSREQRGSAFQLYRKPHAHHVSSVAGEKLAKKPSFRSAVLDLFRGRRGRARDPPPPPDPGLVHAHNARVRSHLLSRSASSCEQPAAAAVRARVPPRRQASFAGAPSPRDPSAAPRAAEPLRRQTSLCDVYSPHAAAPPLRRQRSLMEYERRGLYGHNLITQIDPVYQRRRDLYHDPPPPLPPPPTHTIYDPLPKPRRTYAYDPPPENLYSNRSECATPATIGDSARTPTESPYATKEEMLRQRFSESPYARAYPPPSDPALPRALSTPPQAARRTSPPPKSLSEPPYASRAEVQYVSRAQILQQKATADRTDAIRRRTPGKEPVYQTRRELDADMQRAVIYESALESCALLAESRTDAEKHDSLLRAEAARTTPPPPPPPQNNCSPLPDDAQHVHTPPPPISQDPCSPPSPTSRDAHSPPPLEDALSSLKPMPLVGCGAPTEVTRDEPAPGSEAAAPQTTWGVFDSAGGVLEDRAWGVSLEIPPKAIAPGVKQKVYFSVSAPRHSQRAGGPPIDLDKGEAMLSPLVLCGPQGLVFLRPVTLRLPHCANAVPSLGLTLKATDTEAHLRTAWDLVHLPATTTRNTVTVKVDHF